MTALATGADEIAIDAQRVSVTFGAHPALADVTATANSSTRLGVVGESGSGKSTLARVLVGILTPTRGAAIVNGVSWQSVRRGSPLRRHIQLIQQDPYAQLTPHLSARATVSEAARVCRRLTRAVANTVAMELLTSLGLSEEFCNRKPRQLSGGQCQRVAIARALASDAKLLVADEPTSALDVSVQAQIINLLLEITADRRRGLVLVSHDLAVVRHLTEEIIVLFQGRLVESGHTPEVLANPQHEYTKRLCAQLDV